ncbi:SapC [Marinomonas gallaica]|uniref:SapC n=1 Tax=Marinomonas gallaica TaxID=1806667 RepID=A0A1C3JUL4_9GAMM|nr:SapC family protein [Marinomonas gallaica]SBT18931.1 SapC [Marinomonas gallaica]SBT21886.1 SapC [Marinomonas gallaica]
MFENVVPISPVTHKNAGWVKPANLLFAAEQTVVPIVVAEVMMLKDMPLAFTRNAANDAFSLVGIQSLHSGYNVYIDDKGKWVGRYEPLLYRCFPFKMMQIENTQKTALCVDSGDFFNIESKESDIRLFNDDGSMSEEMTKHLNLVKLYDKSMGVTRKLVAQLDSLGLIQPWDLHMQAGSLETAKPIKGLYHVDETALKALTAEQHNALVKSGAMALIYGQLFSQHCVEFIGLQYRLKNEAVTFDSLVDTSIDELFDEGNKDIFQFD